LILVTRYKVLRGKHGIYYIIDCISVVGVTYRLDF
jgi:hypothetical protein